MKNDIIRFIPMGGQAEMGKSMYCLEINEKIMEYQEVLTWLQQNNYYSLWGDNKDESN